MSRPAHLAEGLVMLSVHTLPSRELRGRYRRELHAELFAMSKARQLRYALGTMTTAWSLRAATAGKEQRKTTMTVLVEKKPLMCRLNVSHRWRTESTPDGVRYMACTRCGRERDVYFGDPGGVVGG